MIGLILLFLGTVAAAVVQYGDHIYFSDDRREVRERAVATGSASAATGCAGRTSIEVREVKDKILILLSRDGRRMLVDAILGYAIARAEILRRAPQAILSGTLASEDS